MNLVGGASETRWRVQISTKLSPELMRMKKEGGAKHLLIAVMIWELKATILFYWHSRNVYMYVYLHVYYIFSVYNCVCDKEIS